LVCAKAARGTPRLEPERKSVVSTIVKAAAVQISPVLYGRKGAVERVVRKIRELRDGNPLLPVLFLVQTPRRCSAEASTFGSSRKP
jgi:hypothetical protein